MSKMRTGRTASISWVFLFPVDIWELSFHSLNFCLLHQSAAQRARYLVVQTWTGNLITDEALGIHELHAHSLHLHMSDP